MGSHSTVLRPCAAPNCGPNILVGRGLCSKHYQRYLRKGTLDDFDRRFTPAVISPEKRKPCGICKRELHLDEFSINGTKLNPERRKSVCKDCTHKRAKTARNTRTEAGICLYCHRPPVVGAVKCAFHLKQRIRYRATLDARVSSLLASAKRRAADNGVLCTIGAEWIRSKIVAARCELTGLPFDLEAGGRRGKFNPYAPSIDRKIAGGDYTPGNCRVILTALNVGINYWGEEIYRTIARAYLRQRREKSKGLEIVTTDMLPFGDLQASTRSH